MNRIKLPRKRKKAFIKARGRLNYLTSTILCEILKGEGVRHANRYYTYRVCKSTLSHCLKAKPDKRW